jgi:hypothetical protein
MKPILYYFLNEWYSVTFENDPNSQNTVKRQTFHLVEIDEVYVLRDSIYGKIVKNPYTGKDEEFNLYRPMQVTFTSFKFVPIPLKINKKKEVPLNTSKSGTSSSSTSNTTKFANESTILKKLSKLCINPKSGTSSSSTSKTVHHKPNFDSLFSTSNTSNRGNSNQEHKLLNDDIINELITKRIPQPVLKLIMDNNGELNNELMNRIITLLDESKLESLLSTVNPSRALTSSSTSLSNIGAERLKSSELNQLDDNQVSKLYGKISDEAMNIILEKQGILGDDLFNQILPLVNEQIIGYLLDKTSEVQNTRSLSTTSSGRDWTVVPNIEYNQKLIRAFSKVKIIDVPGNGNCLFSAVVRSLFDGKIKFFDKLCYNVRSIEQLNNLSMTLRLELARWVNEHKPDSYFIDRSLVKSEYLTTLRMNGEWGSALDLTFISEWYEVGIFVFYVNSIDYKIYNWMDLSYSQYDSSIYLVYIKDLHYMAVV